MVSTINFDVLGVLKVGDSVFNATAQPINVVLEGELITGGCTDAAIVSMIGINNIISVLNHDEVLSQYSIDDLIDHLINGNRSEADLNHIIAALTDAFVEVQ